MTDKKFTPDWTNTPPVPGSYRSIVKEGRQDQVKVPSWQYYEQIKHDLKLDDNYFTNKQDGNQPLRDIPKSNLDTKIIEEIIGIVGAENVQCDDYNRVKYSYGKLAEEMVALKRGILHEITGAAVHPRDKHYVQKIVKLCDEKKVPIYVYGGGSSCNMGFKPEKEGVTLVLNTRMNKGLRPLVEDQTKDVYKTSRKYEIFDHEQDGLAGMLTVEGGKYTTSRNLVENVLKTVGKKFERKAKSVTAKRFLVKSEIIDMDEFIESAKATYSEFPQHTVDYLARLYGTKLPQAMNLARSDKSLAAPLNADGEMSAQVVYAIREEMACTLTDALIRRTGIGTLGNPGSKILEAIAEIYAKELGWSKERTEQEIETARKTLSLPD